MSLWMIRLLVIVLVLLMALAVTTAEMLLVQKAPTSVLPDSLHALIAAKQRRYRAAAVALLRKTVSAAALQACPLVAMVWLLARPVAVVQTARLYCLHAT